MTSPYDVLIGIDQGEVISPLLWCIYYDPLLCEIESKQLGYNLNHSYRKNLYSQNITIEQQIVSSSAFMDDTTWIAPNQSNLEVILEIADNFNHLNNIKVNKEKSELLQFTLKTQYQETINLQFGSTSITIRPCRRAESIRFLGV